ncbi:MAG: EpsG family protein [Bacteroidetes bacterium]|nr:EpsG family protein [Bacteroidota bacterium]
MNKSSLHYDTETVFSKCYPDFDQQVFFNATLFNYICVVITCIGIYRIVRQVANNELYAFIFGSIYLFGFGTLFFSLKPLTEACGILLLAYAFYHYVKQSNYIYIFLLLSIFQREYTFFAFGIISLIDYYFLRKRYYLFVFVSSVFFFFIYFVLRKTFFFTPHYEFQTSLKTFLNSIIYPDMDWISFLKQSLLISNILIIYFLALVYKKYKRMQINWRHLLITIVLLIHVLLMCIMAKFGNNAGRYFYYTAPIIIFYLSIEMKPLLRNYLRFDE